MVDRLSTRETGGRELLEFSKVPTVAGYLYRRGFFNDWRKRYVELHNNELTVSMMKGGMGYVSFKLGTKTRCSESSIKHFCFILSNPGGETIYFAAENIAIKETWTEAIQGTLSRIRLASRKARCMLQTDGSRATNTLMEYQQRPQVFIKIIRARNLAAKDSNGFSDPYVKISMGNSMARTTTRKKDLNPEWGMVFAFDWDRTMRYVKIDMWDEDDLSSHDFLGNVLIPLYSLRDGNAIQKWYPLGRRSNKSHVSGEIEIEIACTGQPDKEQNTWHLFHSLQSMPQLSLNMASKVDGSGQIALRHLFEGVPNTAPGTANVSGAVTPCPLPSETTVSARASEYGNGNGNGNGRVADSPVEPSTPNGTKMEQRPSAVNYISVNDGAEVDLAATGNPESVTAYNSLTNGGSTEPSATSLLKGFPLHYPPIEIESLEDISLRVSILCVVNATKVTCPGVLFLTNFRLIFVSLSQLCKKVVSPSELMGGTSNSASLDLTTQIPLSSIMSATLITENDGQGYGPLNAAYDGIRVRTTESRTVSFLFKDDVDPFSQFKEPAKVILHKATDLLNSAENALQNVTREMTDRINNLNLKDPLRQKSSASASAATALTDPNVAEIYGGGLSADVDRQSEASYVTSGSVSSNAAPTKSEVQAKLKGHTNKKISAYNYSYHYRTDINEDGGELMNSAAETALLAVCKEPSAVVEASDSAEGPPAHRMYLRLKLLCCNRNSQRINAMTANLTLLNALAHACGQSTNDSDHEVIRMTSTLPKSPLSANLTGFDFTKANGDGNDTENGPQPQELQFEESVINPAHLPMGWISNVHNDGYATEPSVPLTDREKLQKECTVKGLERKVKRNDELTRTTIKLLFNLENCWNRYVPLMEFKRMGIPNKYWRITEANRTYQMCPTYPAILAVPDCIQDSDLAGAAAFRSKGRIPALSWYSTKNNCTISRCSQPLIGLSNSRCPEDEKILSAANRAGQFKGDYSLDSGTPKEITPLPRSLVKPYIIVDARPLLNAKANQAAGKGVESDKVYENVSVVFMDIANIHAVRKSLEILEEACSDEASWVRNLESSGWLGHIRKILLAAGRIAHCIDYEQLSVLVHCSDGWDRTSQLTSLSMLMLDDYYRTLDGFIVLIEKEWLSFGHKFGDRLGYTVEGWKDEERSPIFAQFLDCVHQMLVQMPNAFEFNQSLLLFLMQHINSGWFGNFFFNTEHELKYFSAQGGLLSIWSVVLGNRESYLNRGYYAHESPIVPVVSKSRLVLWSAWFLRWHDTIWALAWLDTNQVDQKKLPGSTSGAWVDDKTVTECKCGRVFTCIRRKHHCRCCGNIFCEACSRELRVIPSVSTWRPCRVCDDCARLIDVSEAETFVGFMTQNNAPAVKASNKKSLSRSFSRRNVEVESDEDDEDDALAVEMAASEM